MKTIGIDMDDTIWSLAIPWVSEVNARHGTSVDPNSIESWDIASYFPTLTEEEVFAPIRDNKFWENIRPFSDAVEYIRKIQEELGYEVYVVTSTYPTAFPVKASIVKEYVGVKYNHIFDVHKKQLLNLDIMIDDWDQNLVGGTFDKIMITANHNKSLTKEYLDSVGIVRKDTWKEIYEYLELKERKEHQYDPQSNF